MLWYIMSVVEMQVDLSWVRPPFSPCFAEGRSFLEERHVHACSKTKLYFLFSPFQTVKEMSVLLCRIQLTILHVLFFHSEDSKREWKGHCIISKASLACILSWAEPPQPSN